MEEEDARTAAQYELYQAIEGRPLERIPERIWVGTVGTDGGGADC